MLCELCHSPYSSDIEVPIDLPREFDEECAACLAKMSTWGCLCGGPLLALACATWNVVAYLESDNPRAAMHAAYSRRVGISWIILMVLVLIYTLLTCVLCSIMGPGPTEDWLSYVQPWC